MRVILRPAAAADIEEAVVWYDRQKAGLGGEFLVVVEATLENVSAHPFQYPVIHRGSRRALIRRFPYGIVYRIYDEVVVVVACMHAGRNPRRWRSRS